MNALDNGTRVSATATSSNSAAASISGVSGKRIFITDITGSSDLAGSTIVVADGGSTIWQDIVGVGYYQHTFGTPLASTVGNAVTVTVTGTSACKANVAGVQL